MLMDKLEQVWAFYLTYNLRAKKEMLPLLDPSAGSPAPGRRLLIIRSDNQQPSPSSPFVSFDRLSAPSFNQSAYQSHGTLNFDINGMASDSDSSSTPKRRWNILKSVFGSTANPKPGEVTPPGSVSDENEINPIDTLMKKQEESGIQVAEEDDSIYEPETPHRQYNFKFSLEWYSQPHKNPLQKSPNPRPLFEPGLPRRTLYHVQHQRSAKALRNSTTTTEESIDSRRDADASTASTRNSYATTKTSVDEETDSAIFAHIEDSKILRDERIVSSKYAGRALAEWAGIISEFDNFFDRRLKEGVPSDELVETPTLSVEHLKK